MSKGCKTCENNGTANYLDPCHKCVTSGCFSEYTPITPPILDSGERREFDSGAVRDIQEGKGRCDLLPLKQVAITLGTFGEPDKVLVAISRYQNDEGGVDYIKMAIIAFLAKIDWSIPHAMLEVSKHFEQGCLKYGERNWELGIPEHCYIDSAVRHYLKWLDGMTDEPHDRAVVWNLLCLWWTHENITEADDDTEGTD